mmetsp:Transcript_15148/g.37901  ORF Transcript_15148/g.37901 Transcript_15148/m.37901 type:complete len:86 (-) Transcript_15148:116-373(-)
MPLNAALLQTVPRVPTVYANQPTATLPMHRRGETRTVDGKPLGREHSWSSACSLWSNLLLWLVSIVSAAVVAAAIVATVIIVPTI